MYFLLKMVIFYCYVSLPVGKSNKHARKRNRPFLGEDAGRLGSAVVFVFLLVCFFCDFGVPTFIYIYIYNYIFIYLLHIYIYIYLLWKNIMEGSGLQFLYVFRFLVAFNI